MIPCHTIYFNQIFHFDSQLVTWSQVARRCRTDKTLRRYFWATVGLFRLLWRRCGTMKSLDEIVWMENAWKLKGEMGVHCAYAIGSELSFSPGSFTLQYLLEMSVFRGKLTGKHLLPRPDKNFHNSFSLYAGTGKRNKLTVLTLLHTRLLLFYFTQSEQNRFRLNNNKCFSVSMHYYVLIFLITLIKWFRKEIKDNLWGRREKWLWKVQNRIEKTSG